MTAFVDRLEGPSPALDVAKDMVTRGLWTVPVGLGLGALAAGFNGAVSVAYAMALVLVNFLLAAYTLAAAARVSFALVAGAALGGYAVRLGLILIAFLLVRDASWMAKVPFGIAIIVTHLVLLVWELRYVSASMAHPGLKPNVSGQPAAGTRR